MPASAEAPLAGVLASWWLGSRRAATPQPLTERGAKCSGRDQVTAATPANLAGR